MRRHARLDRTGTDHTTAKHSRLRWVGVVAATAVLGVVGAACSPATRAPAPAPAACGMNATTGTILANVNQARANAGLAGLSVNGQLTCLADGWSAYLASTNGFSHRDLAGVLASPGYAAYHTLGENILRGSASMSAADMHTAWMNSPDHRANILSPSFSSVGIGLAYANGQVWATEDFGG